MTFAMVDIGKPAGRGQPAHDYAVNDFIGRPFLLIGQKPGLVIVGDIEIHIMIQVLVPQPNHIILQVGKHFLIGNGVHISQNDKLLLCFHNPRQKLSELRKWRICNDNISLIPELPHFQAVEISISF